jgi:hypothetical protein
MTLTFGWLEKITVTVHQEVTTPSTAVLMDTSTSVSRDKQATQEVMNLYSLAMRQLSITMPSGIH